MQHHPVFSEFRGYAGPCAAGVETDWSGMVTSASWSGAWSTPASAYVEPPHPALDEEYFEWIDLLSAVSEARGMFTMLELGAGYGRWGVRGAKMASQKGLPSNITFVEAEPQHVLWLREALGLNGVDGRIVEGALAYDERFVPFFVGGLGRDAANWYGQSVVPGDVEASVQRYFGQQIHVNSSGWETIMAQAVTLEEVIGEMPVVDLLDADLQGAEREMILNSMDVMTARVKRVHIGTHGEDIEQIARDQFSAYGWRNVWDFGLNGEHESRYGRCWFGDGVSSWLNPRLTSG